MIQRFNQLRTDTVSCLSKITLEPHQGSTVATFFAALAGVIGPLLFFPAQAQAGVDTIEPPFWWAGMETNTIELMLIGEELHNVTVSIASGDAEVVDQYAPANDDYHFVTLDLSHIDRAQAQTLLLRYADGTEQELEFSVREREPHPMRGKGFSAKDTIYLITPDRFANGNAANDALDYMRESISDRSEPYARHGGDLAGVHAALPYLHELGMTRIWLNPVLENDMPESSYHGYAITDLYRIDPRFGDMDAFRALTRDAARMGIGLVWDAVPNHIGRHHRWMDSLPEADWVHDLEQSGFSNHRRETVLDPYAVPDDRDGFNNGWFVTAMPDLNQRNPRVARYLTQNTIWLIEHLGINSLRVDTYPYSDADFMRTWVAELRTEYPELSIVGEEWSYLPSIVAHWQKQGSPSMMDFPLNEALLKGLTEEESWNGGIVRLYQTLASDYLYPDASALVIFPDNHDMSRIHTAMDEDIALTRMALSLAATLRGTPQIFYGTELLLSHPGTESHGALRMDFPGGWEDDTANGFTGEGLSRQAVDFQAWFRDLFTWRRSSDAVGTGEFRHRAPKDGVYAYSRRTANDQVIVITNNTNTAKTVERAWLEPLVSGLSTSRWQSVPHGVEQALTFPIELPAKSVLILDDL